MTRISIMPLLGILLFLSSCKNTDSSSLLPSVKGDANSLVVVISGQNWESEAGDSIRASFSAVLPGLPQDEPMFDMLFVPHANFDKVYKLQRNIVVIQIGPDYKENFLVSYNPWAKPQIVITIMAPDKEAFVQYFASIQQNVKKLILDFERERLISNYKSATEQVIYTNLLEKHMLDMAIPQGYKLASDSKELVWYTNEYRDIIEGIIIYSYPYTDTNTFTVNYLVDKRNELLKKYVQGEIDGSYITTEERMPVEAKSFYHNGKFAMEMRGLWRMEKGVAMGGPFVSITQYDEKRQRIVTAEGFIFAPAHKKRNLLRRVEAIIYSMKFPE